MDELSQTEIDNLLKDFNLPPIKTKRKTRPMERLDISTAKRDVPRRINQDVKPDTITFQTYRPKAKENCPYCNKEMKVVMICRDRARSKYLLYCDYDGHYQGLQK